MRVQHFDRIEIRWDKSTLRTNPDSTRTVDGFGAHVGPYTYHDDKGRPFVERVPAATLFDHMSLDSAAGSTLTIRHGPGLVTPDRYRAEAHGSWVKAWDAGEGQLGVRLRLGSQEALDFVDKAIANGDPVELSPVYEVDVVERTNADGKVELVQEGRAYSGIAMLGPNEARGGAGTRLQLDGPECAPEGSRVQVSTGRLDSAPRVPLQSVPTGSNTMKHCTITVDGKKHSLSEARARGLAPIKVDAANADQIAVGRVLVEIEGEEPVDLMLPVAMIEMLLEGIGAGPVAAAPPEPAPEDEVGLESVGDAEDEDEKMDAKLDAKIKRAVDRAVGKSDAKRTQFDALRTTVNADASPLLAPGYDYSVNWTQVAVDAIAMGKPELETRAKEFARKAVNGDATASGRLQELLSQCSRDRVGGLNLTPGTTPKADAGGNAWDSETMPGREGKQ